MGGGGFYSDIALWDAYLSTARGAGCYGNVKLSASAVLATLANALEGENRRE